MSWKKLLYLSGYDSECTGCGGIQPEMVIRVIWCVQELAAGGFAGAVAKSVVAPLERCKILYQVRFFFQYDGRMVF